MGAELDDRRSHWRPALCAQSIRNRRGRLKRTSSGEVSHFILTATSREAIPITAEAAEAPGGGVPGLQSTASKA